jgi:hypothetical protein
VPAQAHEVLMTAISRFPRFFAITALLATSSVSFAQDEEERKVKYKERTEIDFEGLDVSGELVKPSGALLLDRKRASFNPLIRLRTDFNQEMAESVDEIK